MKTKKAVVVGLFVSIFVFLSISAVWAGGVSHLPQGARRIDPIRIDDRVSPGAVAAQRFRSASIEIPPMPTVFLYSVLTK